MSACCRRLTSPATAAVHHIPLRPSSSTNLLQVIHRKFRRRSGAVEVVLRSKRLVIEAAAAGGHDDDEVKKKAKQPPRCYSLDRDAVALAKVNCEGVDRRTEVVIAVVATVVLGVGNRVLYKLALVPLKHYPFFLAQLATFG